MTGNRNAYALIQHCIILLVITIYVTTAPHLYPLGVALPDDGPLVVVLFEVQQLVDPPVELEHAVQNEASVTLRTRRYRHRELARSPPAGRPISRTRRADSLRAVQARMSVTV